MSFDVPFPANYGGVIDVYYKLVWLKKAGIKIYLHCFTYGRKPAPELEQLCEKVYYYERHTGIISNFGITPYTVKSRQSPELEKNLLSNDFPILFEVLHTTYLLKDPRFKNRKKIYRHSNIEHDYYNELAKSEKTFSKKIYLKLEAMRLRWYESILNHADLILAVNKKDTLYFQTRYPKVKSVYLPSFHPNMGAAYKGGHSDYLLFHGNLSVSENYKAVDWLIKNIFSKINHQVIIAGLNPPDFLVESISKHKNLILKSSPNEEEITSLIRNAQIHVLYTAQPTGLKLKLLNVLFKGRFILCNSNMLSGTDISANHSLFVCETGEEFIDKIHHCFFKEFSEDLHYERVHVIGNFDNKQNAARLIAEVF